MCRKKYVRFHQKIQKSLRGNSYNRETFESEFRYMVTESQKKPDKLQVKPKNTEQTAYHCCFYDISLFDYATGRRFHSLRFVCNTVYLYKILYRYFLF